MERYDVMKMVDKKRKETEAQAEGKTEAVVEMNETIAKEEKMEEKGVKEIVAAEEVKEIQKVPVAEAAPEEAIKVAAPSSLDNWKPVTLIGKKVFSGEISDIDVVFGMGLPIREPQIIDKIVPDLKNEIILIGGRTGKGGGVQRIPVKITAKMHRSGRRLSTSAFVVVGNENGLIGVGGGHAIEARDAIAKAIQRAKLNLVRVKRGCGSWECRCGTEHSVAFKTTGKSGSVRVELLPAPKGIGLVADDESKKILRLAGIKDVWVRTFGNTSARINLVTAIYDALKKLYIYEREEGKSPRKKIFDEIGTAEEAEEEMSDEEMNEEDAKINEEEGEGETTSEKEAEEMEEEAEERKPKKKGKDKKDETENGEENESDNEAEERE